MCREDDKAAQVPLDRSVCPEVKTVKCFSTEAQTQTVYGSARDGGPWRGPGERALPSSAVGEPRGGGLWETPREPLAPPAWGGDAVWPGSRVPERGRGRLLPSRWALTSLFPQCVRCRISLAREASGTLCGSGPAEGIMSFSPACLSRSHALTCCHGKLYDGPIKQNRKKRRVERAVGFAGPRSPSGLRERSRL